VRRRWFPALAGVAALGIAVVTARGRGQRLDRKVYRALNGTGGPLADAFFASVTEFGSIWASAGAAAAVARSGRRREAVDAMGAAGAMWVLGQILKRIVLRPRPYAALEQFRLLIRKPRGTTWPSSHPAVLLAFVSVAARNLGARDPVKSGVLALAGLVGLSRVYLGVHYPADVAGGLLLGRGVADLWSAVISPHVLGRLPDVSAPVQ
jgi:membrane-associated phospholipid phosphatase